MESLQYNFWGIKMGEMNIFFLIYGIGMGLFLFCIFVKENIGGIRMKRLPNGIPILYELHNEVEFEDEFGSYKKDLYIRLIWHKGFRWCISTGDFVMSDKSLVNCTMSAIRILLTGKLTPCYYRLKEHNEIIKKDIPYADDQKSKVCTYYTKNETKPYCTHDCDGCIWFDIEG